MPELPTTATLHAFLTDVANRKVWLHAEDLLPYMHLDDDEPADVTVMVGMLERRGLIELHPSDTHYVLTDEGRAVHRLPDLVADVEALIPAVP